MKIGKYIKEGVIGSGTYGTVYKAREVGSDRILAIKQINNDEVEDGIPASTIREIGILLEFQQQRHPNIVELLEVIHRDGDISMVFEYVEYDLRRFHEEYSKIVNQRINKENSPIGLPINFVKNISRQIMEAVLFCHQHKVFHRDIKPSNLLLTNSSIIKLADFGLSRTYSLPNRSYCHEIITLWYRAPEIMLGSNQYTTSIDVWSIGCLITEMITGKVLFPGDSEIDQLFLIFRRFGTPNERSWPGVTLLPDFKSTFPEFKNKCLSDLSLSSDASNLISTMLSYLPENRDYLSNLVKFTFVRDPPPLIPLKKLLSIK